ncbi:unnamed protein product [Closterium sp. NIES-54]
MGVQCEWDGGLESIVAAAAAMPSSQQAQSASGTSHSANNQPASGSPSLSQQSDSSSASNLDQAMESFQAMRDSLRSHLSALYGEARRRLPAALASAQVASVCFAAVMVLVLMPLGLWIGRLGMGVKMIYGFVLGIACALLYSSLAMRNAWQRERKALVSRRMDWEMSVDEILRLAGFSEGNCTSSCQKLHTFQLAWVNAAVRKMWPELCKASAHMLRSSLQGLFEGYHFGVITGIDVRSVDLGPDPPTITAVRVRRGGADNGGAQSNNSSSTHGGNGRGGGGDAGVVTVAEAKEQAERETRAGAEAQVMGEGQGEGLGQREEQGQGEGEEQGKGEGEGEGVWEEKRGGAEAKEQGQGGEGEGEGEGGGGAEEGVAEEGVADEVMAEVAVEWVEGRVQQRSMRLRVQTAMSPDVDVQVSSIAAAATLKLTLKPLLPRLPGFGAVLLSLLNQPFFDFKVSVMGGNLKAMPGFEKMIEVICDFLPVFTGS